MITRHMLVGGLVLAAALTLAPEASAGPAKVLVLIVHKDSPIKNLSRAEIRDIFLKRRQVWPNGQTIIPINGPLEAQEKKAFDKLLLGMTTQELGVYWVKEAVVGRATPPRRVASMNLAKQMVAALPGAITYIDLDKVDGKVKVISIDDLAPSDPRYQRKYQH
jgi:ABC-type phosphate transport system substrate-binding protein